jgi:hypothetical protein
VFRLFTTLKASIERFKLCTGIRYPASEWHLGMTTIFPTSEEVIDDDRPFGLYRFRLDMFHEQLPLPVPCYDLLPVIEFAVVLQSKILGTSNFLELTGGEYKTRERIHRGMADPRLLAIPASSGRLQTAIRTGVSFWDLLHLAVLLPSVLTIVSRVRPRASRDMLIWRHPHLPPP